MNSKGFSIFFDNSLLWLILYLLEGVLNPYWCFQIKIVLQIPSTNQMPSLRMKTKLATSSSKEKNGLHVCPNSSVISKSSLSRTRSVQNADEVADLIHNTHDGRFCSMLWLFRIRTFSLLLWWCEIDAFLITHKFYNVTLCSMLTLPFLCTAHSGSIISCFNSCSS